MKSTNVDIKRRSHKKLNLNIDLFYKCNMRNQFPDVTKHSNKTQYAKRSNQSISTICNATIDSISKVPKISVSVINQNHGIQSNHSIYK